MDDSKEKRPDILVNDRAFAFNGKHVALSGFLDAILEQSLVQAGALLCTSDSPDLEVVVIDSSSVNVDVLREEIADESLKRLQDGSVRIFERTQIMEHFRHGDTDADFESEDSTVHRLVTRAMLAEMLGVTVASLRSWQRRGLIQPINNVNKLDYFDFQEVAAAKQIATLVELGIKPAAIQKHMRQLAAWLPAQSRPLSQMSLLVDGKKILLRFDRDESADGLNGFGYGLVEAGGQRLLPLIEDQIEARGEEESLDSGNPGGSEAPDIIPFRAIDVGPQEYPSPASYVQAAEDLEDSGDLRQAIDVYRTMQFAYGPVADISLRIGELLFRMGDMAAARERYFMAIELDESMVEARAALGCVLVELVEYEHAISAFQGALEFHPDYADVHFHLARVLQTAGDDVQALRHWERFVSLSVSLSPNGPWAEEARSQVEFLRAKLLVDSSPDA